jgi:flagellar motor switch protein FliN/FliY
MADESKTTSDKSPAAAAESGRGAADAEKLLQEAESALQQAEQSLQGPPPAAFRLEELIGEGGPPEKSSMDLIRDVDLDLKIELGRTNMSLEDVLRLRRGSVVTLDKLAGDPVDIYVNGRLIARGEVLVLNDNFCVRVAELLGSDSLSTE